MSKLPTAHESMEQRILVDPEAIGRPAVRNLNPVTPAVGLIATQGEAQVASDQTPQPSNVENVTLFKAAA